MRAIVAHADQATDASERIPIVIFTLGAQHYAVPVTTVIEIVRLPALTLISGVAPNVSGLLNWHGRYLPVLDGRALVDAPSCCDLSSQIILVGSAQTKKTLAPQLGILVDTVDCVQAITAASLTSLPPNAAAPFLSAIFHESDGRSAVIFDVAALLELAPVLDQAVDLERRNGTPNQN